MSIQQTQGVSNEAIRSPEDPSIFWVPPFARLTSATAVRYSGRPSCDLSVPVGQKRRPRPRHPEMYGAASPHSMSRTVCKTDRPSSVQEWVRHRDFCERSKGVEDAVVGFQPLRGRGHRMPSTSGIGAEAC